MTLDGFALCDYHIAGLDRSRGARRGIHMQPFFDAHIPYYVHIENGQFSRAIEDGLSLLEQVKQCNPKWYATESKGTPFYWFGVAAFHAHDYQTAAFFFDAAMSEDLEHHPGRKDTPAQLFMLLDKKNQKQAARNIVVLIVNKLDGAVKDYVRRSKGNLGTEDVRDRFLRYVLDQNEPRLRTLTTTLVSFLAEWDYRLSTLDLSHLVGSREPFFTHLLRGCLLFESLIKENPKVKVPPRCTLEKLLNEPTIFQALRMKKKVRTSKADFDHLVRSLKSDQPLQEAIQCTLDVRNKLAHRLGLEAKLLDREKYRLLASNIVASCLHVIACLYH